jgi:hypothetical protein
MTNDELNGLVGSPFSRFVYADRNGISATLSGRNIETKTVEVPNGCPGMVESISENSLTVRWDHYFFENHAIQELLPNPVSVITDLASVRLNRFPPNVRYC